MTKQSRINLGDPEKTVPYSWSGYGIMGHGANRDQEAFTGGVAMLDPEGQAEYIKSVKAGQAKIFCWRGGRIESIDKDDSNQEKAIKKKRNEALSLEAGEARAKFGNESLEALDPSDLAKALGHTGRGEPSALKYLRGLSNDELQADIVEVEPVAKPGRKRRSKKSKTKATVTSDVNAERDAIDADRQAAD